MSKLVGDVGIGGGPRRHMTNRGNVGVPVSVGEIDIDAGAQGILSQDRAAAKTQVDGVVRRVYNRRDGSRVHKLIVKFEYVSAIDSCVDTHVAPGRLESEPEIQPSRVCGRQILVASVDYGADRT